MIQPALDLENLPGDLAVLAVNAAMAAWYTGKVLATYAFDQAAPIVRAPRPTSQTKAEVGDSIADIPTKSIVCLALIKSRSRLALEWKLSKPSCGIYERPGRVRHLGASLGRGFLAKEDYDDLVLGPVFNEEEVEALFD